MNPLLVALVEGGGTAALCLAGIPRGPLGTDFPWDMFLINVSGSFLIAVVLGLVLNGFPPPGPCSSSASSDATPPFSTYIHKTLQLLTADSLGTAARRVYSMPNLKTMPAALSNAMHRAEKSAHEREVVRRPKGGTLPGKRYRPGHGGTTATTTKGPRAEGRYQWVVVLDALPLRALRQDPGRTRGS